MIYILEKMKQVNDDLNLGSTENLFMRLFPLLSEERKQKALSYHFYADRLQSAAVYVLLRYCLKVEFGIAEIPEFSYSSAGKPSLKKWGDICFSFSHSKDVAACMISDTEVGIDVQERFSFEQGIVEQICSENERVLFNQTMDKERLLNRLWVLKEAYTKYLGTGITIDLKQIDFHKEAFWDNFKITGTVFAEQECFLKVIEQETYYMAVCSNREEQELEYVTMDELTRNLNAPEKGVEAW